MNEKRTIRNVENAIDIEYYIDCIEPLINEAMINPSKRLKYHTYISYTENGDIALFCQSKNTEE